ncbi:amidohydrolase [Oceanobacillus neutriphilus]|uniref:Amidohydrolase AmhX n=1 Tax=Oceanobacillus neutriphilus TaxID=531815 RepID=A0ABQ2NUZ6_9BACI|nr:amidohydrolase [Oceanobacillus neutriphilus]GGP11114.1 amidohydrolase AmhX [Oceanobacillus neutriphilus]
MTNQKLAERLQPIFKHLHDNPEISWNEVETTAYLVHFLRQQGLKPQTFSNMTGLYVDIGKGTPKVGFRTDIDALWQEVNGEFQANHSCGHDGHMTVALGVVLLLKELEPTLPGAVRVLFQPAEEKAQGAKAFVDQGVVDPLQYLFGTHVRPLIELEDGAYAPALHHGAAKLFTGEIHGVEAHGARPEQGANAIEAAAALIDGLKRIWISPAESASIKMTQIQAGGTSTNIIPGSAIFSIDARAQTNETMEALTAGFEKAVKAVSTLYDVSIDYKVDAHIAAAQVDDTAKSIMKQAIIDVAGEENCAPEVVTPGGEDFHFYTYSKPRLQTTMLGLGCGVTPGLHHPKMTFNQERLPTGTEIITRALVLALQQTKKEAIQK